MQPKITSDFLKNRYRHIVALPGVFTRALPKDSLIAFLEDNNGEVVSMVFSTPRNDTAFIIGDESCANTPIMSTAMRVFKNALLKGDKQAISKFVNKAIV